MGPWSHNYTPRDRGSVRSDLGYYTLLQFLQNRYTTSYVNRFFMRATQTVSVLCYDMYWARSPQKSMPTGSSFLFYRGSLCTLVRMVLQLLMRFLNMTRRMLDATHSSVENRAYLLV